MITATPTDHTSYVFTYVEREKVGQQSPDQALAGARDGALRKVQGTLLTQKTITVQGYPGLDVQARARGNSFVDLRFVVVGNRLFMIMAVATVEGIENRRLSSACWTLSRCATNSLAVPLLTLPGTMIL
jgi:hypothetical protein